MSESTLARQLDAVGGDRYVPPQNMEAEESVLGAIFLENRSINIVHFLDQEDFYREKHRRIFAAMRALSKKNEAIDLVTVAEELKKRDELEACDGETYLMYLVSRTPTWANVEHYADIIKAKAQLRGIDRAAHNAIAYIRQNGAEPREVLSKLQDDLIAVQSTGDWTRGKTNADAAYEAIRELEKNQERRAEGELDVAGISSSLQRWDNCIGTMRPGTMIVLASDTSYGKSMLAQQIAMNVSEKHPVCYVTCEMTVRDMMYRQFSATTGVAYDKYIDASLSDDDVGLLADKLSKITSRRIRWVDQKRPSLPDMAAVVKSMVIDEPDEQGLLVVDYLQLLAKDTDDERRALSQLTTGLKQLAMETGWTVVLISQFNRDGKKQDEAPQTWHLKGSGTIEDDADVIVFLWPDDRKNPDGPGWTKLVCRKHRYKKRPPDTPLYRDFANMRFLDQNSKADIGDPEDGGQELAF